MNIIEISPDKLVPYDKNNKKHSRKQIDEVAESINRFGFIQPVVIDKNNVIVIGHGRSLAAKKLGLKTIPCVYVDDLTDDQIKALRIVDNKVVSTEYDIPNLIEEISFLQKKPDFSNMFSDWDKQKKKIRAGWTHTAKRCDLVHRFNIKRGCSYIYHSFFKVSKTGKTFDEIKNDPAMVPLFANNVSDFLEDILGTNYNGWCILTTPRRRHSEWHFATEVCKKVSEISNILFIEDAFKTKNKDRLHPKFKLTENIIPQNVILYDDIITTGNTLEACRNLLLKNNHNVFIVISIDNR